MAKATQEDRLLLVNTPLGKDYLVIENIEVKEKISELFEIKVRLLYDEEEDDKFDVTPIKINQILGQTVSVALTQPDGNKRVFSGMVKQLLQIGRNRRFTFYDATIVPHIWKLTQNSQSRIFQQKRVPDILQEVFDGFEIKMQLQAEYKPRNYCVQYQESDWDFASRLMEEEGIYYYFEHAEETLKLVLRDNFKNPENCPNKHEIPIYDEDLDPNEDWESAVKSIQMNYTLRTGKVTVWDYNFQLTKKTLDAEEKSQYSIGNNQELESYTFPTGYARKYDGIDKSGGEQPSNLNDVFPDIKRTAQNRLAALDSQHKVLKGISDCCSITPGYRFQLKNHPNKEFNVQYIVLSVEHHANQIPSYTSADKDVPTYKNEFTCIPHGSGQPEFRPPLKTKKPVMHGSQTAFVVGPSGEEIFTDKYGRVKIQFHWDRTRKFDPDSSCWVRVAREIAGNKWGSMHIPRIGQEVIVDFIEGDPDQPIITGSVYNPETMPHYELPKYKTLTYFKTRTTPDDGKGFNELRFEDKAGKEQVFMRSQLRMDVRVRGSYYKTVGGNRQEIIGVRSDNKPGGNLAITVGGNYDLHVKADQFIGIDGKLNEGIKGNVLEVYDSAQQTFVKSKVEINAKEITLEGSQKVTLKVGSSCVIVDMMGITIQGPMVKINSGGAAAPVPPANLEEPLDAETADTGEPGYLERKRSGSGSGGGRRSRQVNGQHAPSVKRNDDGSYQVGKNIRVEGSDEFVGKTLNNLSTLNNTPTGNKILTELDNGTHKTTIKELDMATAQKNGALAGPDDPAGSVTPGKGSDTTVSYNPDLVDNTYVDENGKNVTMPIESTLGHELIHAVHNDKGNNKRDNPEPAEPDSNEEESQTIGIHNHKDDDLTENNLLKDLGQDFKRTDHDSTVKNNPK